MLGEFEYAVLSAAAQLGDEAYGAAIASAIEKTGRRCSVGALYTTIERLESKGLIRTRMGEATPERGGRPKRMVTITAKGAKAATEFYQAINEISRGVPWVGRLPRSAS